MKKSNQYSEQCVFGTKRIASKCVPRNALLAMKLCSKTRCAWCETPLVFLYGEFNSGSITVRCSSCRKTTMIDFSRNESLKVINE